MNTWNLGMFSNSGTFYDLETNTKIRYNLRLTNQTISCLSLMILGNGVKTILKFII